MQQLGGISGVGEKKLVTYGEGVIGVLASLGGSPDSAPSDTAGAAAATAAATADTGAGTPDLWPDTDEEPEPEDWI